MQMTVKPPSMIKEKKNGGRWNNRMKKSEAKRLVSKGWLMKLSRIFLNISVSSGRQKSNAKKKMVGES
jgi:hypothetical protein